MALPDQRMIIDQQKTHSESAATRQDHIEHSIHDVVFLVQVSTGAGFCSWLSSAQMLRVGTDGRDALQLVGLVVVPQR